MKLELHDSEVGNSLNARVNDIEYDYQAEIWVSNTAQDRPEIVKWVLKDDLGDRCIWERPAGNTDFPKITSYTDRFTGSWEIPQGTPRTTFDVSKN